MLVRGTKQGFSISLGCGFSCARSPSLCSITPTANAAFMSLGKIEFGARFYGREVERQQLKDAYLRVDRQPLVILLGGRAGAGKTRLVEQVISELQQDVLEGQATPFFYCSGKADELLCTDPFSSIVGAFAALAKALVGDDVVRQRILRAVGSEGRVLTQAIPELEDVLGEQRAQESTSATTTRNRFTYLFQALLRAICTPAKPLILHLDDLQWTDASSLALIRDAMMCPDLSHFLFIGSYRDDGIEPGHPLTQTLDAWRENGNPYLTLTVGNLSRPQAHDLIEDALNQRHIDGLVEAVYLKSRGNPFSLRAVLQLMTQRNVLRFVEGVWEWDIDVDDHDDVSDDATLMVLSKLRCLTADVQLVMMTAAFLRSTFPRSTLIALLEDAFDREAEWPTILDTVEHCQSEGLLEAHESGSCRFVHDRVRQASLELADAEGMTNELSHLVGRYLLQSPGGEDWMFFAGVDHWNSIPLSLLKDNGCDAFHLASLNLQAGKRASEVAAFASASTYLRHGVALLEREPDRWRLQYTLCLDLYSSAAEVEFCVGSFEAGERHTHEVMTNTFRPVDTTRVYWSLADALGRSERHKDAMDVSIKQLRMLKEAPKGVTTFGILRKLYKVKKMARRLSLEQLVGLTDLVSPDRIAVVESLNQVLIRSIWSAQKRMSLWATLRMCEITFTEGICKAGLVGISTLAVFFEALPPPVLDFELGRKLNSATRRLAARLNAVSVMAQLSFYSGWYVATHLFVQGTKLTHCTAALTAGMTRYRTQCSSCSLVFSLA